MISSTDPSLSGADAPLHYFPIVSGFAYAGRIINAITKTGTGELLRSRIWTLPHRPRFQGINFAAVAKTHARVSDDTYEPWV